MNASVGVFMIAQGIAIRREEDPPRLAAEIPTVFP